MFIRTTLYAAVLLLAACGNGSGNSSGNQADNGSGGGRSGGGTGSNSGSCVTMGTGNYKVTTQIDPGCASCSVTNQAQAADGSLSTSATLSVNNAAATQGASIRVTAQPGIVYPSGRMAGAYVSVPAATGQSYTVTVRTLLSGTVQESNASDNSGGASGVTGGHGSAFDGLKTTKPFDALEVFISNTQASGTPNFQVYELCSDSGP